MGEKFGAIDNDPAYWGAFRGGETQTMTYFYPNRVEDTSSMDDLVGSIDDILDRVAPLVNYEVLHEL